MQKRAKKDNQIKSRPQPIPSKLRSMWDSMTEKERGEARESGFSGYTGDGDELVLYIGPSPKPAECKVIGSLQVISEEEADGITSKGISDADAMQREVEGSSEEPIARLEEISDADLQRELEGGREEPSVPETNFAELLSGSLTIANWDPNTFMTPREWRVGE